MASTVQRGRSPAFLIQHESRFSAWQDLLKIICAQQLPSANVRPVRMFARVVESNRHRDYPALLSSVLLHFAVAASVVYAPRLFPADSARKVQEARNVYEIHDAQLSVYFPVTQPTAQPKGRKGPRAKRSPASPPANPGTTTFDPKLTIISRPRNADNRRQTIRQASAPPELKIPLELRLPDIMIRGAATPPEPLAIPTPNQAPAVPALAAHMKFPVPLPSAPYKKGATEKATPVPNIDDQKSTSSNVVDLLSVSINPAPLGDSLVLPQGNRNGTFAISPTGTPSVPLGSEPGGNAKRGDAGDSASGNGGPGDDAGSGVVGLNGTGGKPSEDAADVIAIGSSGAPSSPSPNSAAMSRVYAVLSEPTPPKIALIITSGSTGGGGLHVYGVLQGSKIYTTILPMPGKNWVLQYCERKSPLPANAQKSAAATVVAVELGLIAPQPKQRLDFHRPEIASVSNDDMIILHGVILDDGSVTNLEILQGVQAEADQAALAAFGRWKFVPASRSGKPVSVEVLVGIPVKVPSN